MIHIRNKRTDHPHACNIHNIFSHSTDCKRNFLTDHFLFYTFRRLYPAVNRFNRISVITSLKNKKIPKNIDFSGFLRGADRIWTGASGCCRPTPYRLATAPYYKYLYMMHCYYIHALNEVYQNFRQTSNKNLPFSRNQLFREKGGSHFVMCSAQWEIFVMTLLSD